MIQVAYIRPAGQDVDAKFVKQARQAIDAKIRRAAMRVSTLTLCELNLRLATSRRIVTSIVFFFFFFFFFYAGGASQLEVDFSAATEEEETF